MNPFRAVRWLLNDATRVLWAVLIVWVGCSMAYWLLERHVHGGPTGPISALWWGIVTASTVGYGDYSPETTPGRFFGAVLIVSMWCLVIAVGAHFTKALLDDPDAWTNDEQEQMKREIAETRAAVEEIRTLLRTPPQAPIVVPPGGALLSLKHGAETFNPAPTRRASIIGWTRNLLHRGDT